MTGNRFPLAQGPPAPHLKDMKRLAPIAAALALSFPLAGETRADGALDYLPGGSAGAATSPGSAYMSKPTYDRAEQRRAPQYRHSEQMRRYWENRAEQRTRAQRSYGGVAAPPPPQERLPVIIRPTVYSYAAALDSVLKIAVGDRVIFRTEARTGRIELLDIGQEPDGLTCRRFRQEVRTPAGAEVSYGSACQMRDGGWRFSME